MHLTGSGKLLRFQLIPTSVLFFCVGNLVLHQLAFMTTIWKKRIEAVYLGSDLSVEHQVVSPECGVKLVFVTPEWIYIKIAEENDKSREKYLLLHRFKNSHLGM